MRIWRDIPSQDAIQRALTPGGSGGDRIRAILALVARYHVIPKTEFAQLGPRKLALDKIATDIAARLNPNVVQRVVGSGLAAQDATILRQLRRRAQAKASYLELLERHYTEQNDELVNPGVLWQQMQAGQQTQGGAIGLTPGSMIEKADPLHRSFDFSIVADPGGDILVPSLTMHSMLLCRWIGLVRVGAMATPLWLFLEDTEFCMDRDAAKAVLRVPYLNNPADVYAIAASEDRATLRQGRPQGTAYVWSPFDTSWVTRLLSAKAGTEGSLAYVWTRQKELFAELHNPAPEAGRDWEVFHHSSFTSGDFVFCAGMIAARNGLITFLSNDSGHYHPDTDHLRRLVKHLNKRNFFAVGAMIRDVSVHGGADVTVAQFMAPPPVLVAPVVWGGGGAVGPANGPGVRQGLAGGHRGGGV